MIGVCSQISFRLCKDHNLANGGTALGSREILGKHDPLLSEPSDILI